MAANCTNLPKQINNGAASMGTFRTGGGPPTSLGYHHNTLTRTTKIGISSLGIGAGAGGGAGVGGLTMAEVKERMATIDGSSQRVRLVRLTRPQSYAHGHFNGGGNFGFSIRGGLEYGTGFFVSAVEKNSEADQQGLRVGDQIIRVNGYQVDDAVHRELAQFVSCQERLVLKVRSVGILPVKERSADPLTWHVVTISTNSGPSSLPNILHPVNGVKKKHPHRSELERTSCSSSSNSSTGSSGTLEEIPGGRDIKVVVSVAPRTKLGCGICKGPDWKPGIFVQFTKEGGVAREAGLRPGDQIMSCNGREFADITFAEAVSIMKASQVLELVVRPGAGIDMFPGESSGYNSSASSVNGDQSPCWGDSTAKRLSIVREESISKDRRSGLQRADKVGPKTAGGHRRNNTTIIEFSENGTVVNSSLISQDGAAGKKEMESKEGSKKLADICFVSKQSETKTVIVEVHRSASTNSIATGSPTSSSSGVSTVSSSGSTSHIPPPPPLFADKIPPPPPPSSGLSSGYSTTNSAKSGGLGTQHQQRSPSSVSLADSSASSGIDCGSSNNGGGGGGIGGLGSAISEELKRRAQKKGSLLSSTAQEPAAALTELENRLKEKRFRPPVNSGSDAARHSALMDEFRAVHKRMFKNGFDNAEIKKAPSKDKLPIEVRPPGATTTCSGSTPSSNSCTQGGKGTMGRVAASELAKANGDIAELESIESFQLTSPTPTPVRPPSYYFCPQNTGPPTMKKSQKPIAVTISEYIGVGVGGNDEIAPDLPKKIGNLKYELEKTLSLSNLRQRSESREDLVERIQIGSQLDQGTRLSRSSSAVTTVSNGNRITIAISNGADKK
ncbi:PDZ domain-containing protein 7 isoform X2 [Aedes albopictus]